MKDNISLIAAAAGGFMLSMALTGILHGTPVTSLSKHVHVESYSVRVAAADKNQNTTRTAANFER